MRTALLGDSGEFSFEDGATSADQVVTFFTADGIVQLPSYGHRRGSSQEQGLCLGATFFVQATNGLDPTRRLHVLGYCRCVASLSEVVEAAVLQRGGEVFWQDLRVHSGLHESLRMTVAIPLLNGVPPESEYLRSAIATGGGFVKKVATVWNFY
ncbi:hypothetical protein WJX81_007039 [Elliptochloris bilobata]|uniref:DUF7811 domain-containing protein n=1 Tax=Elliptochloris bilobata TaxID=381761 RepID=A0AAW1S1R5_9CHLO